MRADYLMMTNNHCVSDGAGVRGSEVWFNYQTTTCTGTTTSTITKVSGNALLRTDFTLDYTLFSVNNFSTISGFGFLNLDPRAAVSGEEIYIPQHGGGQRKQLQSRRHYPRMIHAEFHSKTRATKWRKKCPNPGLVNPESAHLQSIIGFVDLRKPL